MAIGFDSSSSINDSNELLGYESLPLSHIRLIKDEELKFYHVEHDNMQS